MSRDALRTSARYQGYWTVIVPCMPSWSWPGCEQKNLYVPGLSYVMVAVPDWFVAGVMTRARLAP